MATAGEARAEASAAARGEPGAEGIDTSARSGEAPPEAAAPVAVPVTRFELPLDELHRIAEGAGLQWVNSDAEKVAAVQAAIAAEPAPVHVPRERKPLPVLDEGPLILVETRRDLSQLKLPFEQQAQAPAAP